VGNKSLEAYGAETSTATIEAGTNVIAAASSVLPSSPSLGTPATVQHSQEARRASRSAADHEVVPDLVIGDAASIAIASLSAANVDELVTLPAADTPPPESQGAADTISGRDEAGLATTTQTGETEISTQETQSLPPAENDATPAADTINDASGDPLSNLISPEVAAGRNVLPAPDEAQTEARANGPEPIAKYRPRLRPRRTPLPRPVPVQTEQEQASGTLEAILLLTFLPGNWGISLAVLLGRADGMPENLDVRVGGATYSLLTIDAKLFEPFVPPGEVDPVGTGFIAEATAPPIHRWVRTKRDLHVFSERPGVSGFASVSRALIGQENVVLCRDHLVATAIRCARATGSAELRQVAGPGIPQGWQCFRDFRPRTPADFGETSDIFLSLNPLPDAAIELAGGIATGRSTWIVGAPPTIRILGADAATAGFTIDGQVAIPRDTDGWLAPGWDAPGTHTIRFGGLSRTYEIVEIDETWSAWPTGDTSAYFACGANVSTSAHPRTFAFAGGPRWLLGASVGEVALAAQSSSGIAIAAPSFRPVWALSARTNGRLSSATALPFHAPPQMPSDDVAREQIVQWCNLLRGSSAPAEANSKELWRQYRQLARKLRRRRR
jgi:hypothetical protein